MMSFQNVTVPKPSEGVIVNILSGRTRPNPPHDVTASMSSEGAVLDLEGEMEAEV